MENSEILEFVKNAKFKISKCTQYRYFNILTEHGTYQMRITKSGKHNPEYKTLLIPISQDGIFYATDYIKNIPTFSLNEAKTEAAKIYFEIIRL